MISRLDVVLFLIFLMVNCICCILIWEFQDSQPPEIEKKIDLINFLTRSRKKIGLKKFESKQNRKMRCVDTALYFDEIYFDLIFNFRFSPLFLPFLSSEIFVRFFSFDAN